MSGVSSSAEKTIHNLPYRPCAGIVIFDRQGRVWAGHRVTSSDGELFRPGHRWQFPQGGIDKGEDPLKAARRELWEETGIKSASFLKEAPDWIYYDLPEELVGVALKGKYRGQKMRWFAFRFEGEDSEINITEPPEGAPVEFDRWQWLPLTEMPERVVPFKRHVYEQIVDAFRDLAMPATSDS